MHTRKLYESLKPEETQTLSQLRTGKNRLNMPYMSSTLKCVARRSTSAAMRLPTEGPIAGRGINGGEADNPVEISYVDPCGLSPL